MADLTLFQGSLAQLVPNWVAGAIVDCVPGSGLPYTGPAILAMTTESIVLVSQEKRVLLTIAYKSIIRIREAEFKGLVIERDGALVAPPESFATEIIYNGPGKFERSIKLLNSKANNARSLVDTLNLAVQNHLDRMARDGMNFAPDED